MMENKKSQSEIIAISVILVLAVLPAMLDSTIVNIAVNDLVKQFSSTLSATQWVITCYVLALGIAVPFSGWLMKKCDGKKVMMGCLMLFLAGSLLSGLSWNMPSLIVFRIVQGLASGLMLPTLTTMIAQTAGSDNIGSLISIVSIPIVFVPIIGPIIGGLILQYLDWHWLFFVNLPIGAIALILMQWKLPHFEATDTSSKLDWFGILLLALISAMSVFGVVEMKKVQGQTIAICSFSVAALSLLVYIFYALKKKSQALIPLVLFRSKNFSASFILLFLAGFATNGPLLLFPLFFQNVRGLSVTMSALWLIPQGVGMLITRSQVGKLTDRIGARFVTLPSVIVVLAGTLPFVFFNAETSQWVIWFVLLIRGMGLGGFTIPVMSDSFVGLKKDQIAAASVATRTIQNVGAAFGSAILGTVVGSVLKNGVQTGVAGITSAYHAGFVTSLFFMVVSILPALFLTNKVRKSLPQPGIV